MRIVFAGTPAFALPTLQALHRAGHDIVAVYTQPDRPAGRGRKLQPSPVKQYALTHGLHIEQPLRLSGQEEVLAALAPEVMVVVAYGLLLPPSILTIPRYGCINVHASLLPRWRGAAPIARAIEAGDTETGITIMQIEAGLDTGPMWRQARTPILASDTATALEERLAALGAETLMPVLQQLRDQTVMPQKQDDTRACYAPKLQKAEALIDWSLPAAVLHRKVRAFNPWPVATTSWHGQALRLWEVGPLSTPAGSAQTPGTVVGADSTGLHVQAGDALLSITRLQTAGSRVLPIGEFLNGTRIRPGDVLGT